MTEVVNASMHAGESMLFDITVLDIANQPYDILNMDIDFSIEPKAGEPTILNKVVGSGISKTGINTYTITINPADTTSLLGWYYMESFITNVSGEVFWVFTGGLNIKA